MTTIKEALVWWSEQEENKKADPTKAKTIELQFMFPPIEKMDNTLSTLVNCEYLSLSTNAIEQISGLNGMKHLKILILARNSITSVVGLQPVAKTLEQLWISYNDIERTKGIEVLTNLKVLSMQFNEVKEWSELDRLRHLPNLTDLYFIGNIINEDMEEIDWLKIAMKKFPNLEVLEGHLVMGESFEEEEDEPGGEERETIKEGGDENAEENDNDE